MKKVKGKVSLKLKQKFGTANQPCGKLKGVLDNRVFHRQKMPCRAIVRRGC